MRRFVGLLLALAISMAPPVRAQDTRALPLVAIFNGGTPDAFGSRHEAFLRAMREAGWRDGENVRYEVRWGGNRLETFASIAEELVRLRPALIVAASSPGAVAVAQAAQGRIPVVTISDDPVVLGLAESHARPGANVTGASPMLQELSMKELEVLQRIRPGAKRLGIIVNPDDAATLKRFKAREAEMRRMTQLVVAEARNAAEIPQAFRHLMREKVEGVIIPLTILFISENASIAQLALENRLPVVFPMREGVEAGGLISYGFDVKGQYAHAARLADRILRGASASVLPIEFMREFEIAVNLKTARAIGVTIPEDLLLRATIVIR